jgi:xylulokinase
MDFSLAGRTMLLDIRSRTPAIGVFAEAGIEPDRFYPMVQATQILGHMQEPNASEFGLSEGVAVVVGGFDQSCCALGAGVIQEGVAALSVGTLEAITPVFREMRLEPPLLEGNHGCIPGLVEGYHSSLAYVTTSGAVIEWFHANFDAANAALDPLFDSVPEGPSGVFVMPYFAGSGTPWLDVRQFGSVFGLSLETGKARARCRTRVLPDGQTRRVVPVGMQPFVVQRFRLAISPYCVKSDAWSIGSPCS